MRHPTHLWTVLLAFGLAAGAQAQTTGGTPKQQAGARASAPSYGPVLHPQKTPPAQSGVDAAPQAQEERAGAAAQQQRQNEVDPSARPSPQPPQPEPVPSPDKKKDAKKENKAKPSTARRNVQQRVEPTPRIAAPSAHPYGRVADPAVGAPSPVVPAPAQINSCSGGVCIDTKGTVYNTSGNTAVSSDGRACNRSGSTMQCF